MPGRGVHEPWQSCPSGLAVDHPDSDREQQQGDRKKRLARLLGKRQIGIGLSQHTDEDRAAIFRQACKMSSKASCQSG
jgi:hypothetical protein